MNCQDIGRLLDDANILQLDEPQQQAVQAHLATCNACAGSWRSHVRLLRLKIPAVPEALISGCRESAERILDSRPGPLRRNRYIVLGSVVALMAAAAALLLPVWRHAGSEAPAVPALAITPGSAASLQSPAAIADTAAQQPEPGADDASRDASPIRVLIAPLQNNATDAATQEAIEQFYAAVLAELEKVPGLVLLEPGTWTDEDEPISDVRLRLSGRPGVAAGKFMGTMRSNSFGAAGKISGEIMQSSEAQMSPGCTRPELAGEGGCEDPAGLAVRMVASLRTNYFPDTAVLHDLRTRVLDSSLSPFLRLRSLVELGRMGSGLPRNQSGRNALRDADIVAAVADLSASTTDPLLRVNAWRAMRGVGGAQLMQALVATSRADPDDRVRMVAVDVLLSDFADDPQARSVLEERMHQDPAPRVRALARRAILGEDAWKAHVRSSLKDTSLSADARITALGYQILHPSALPGSYALAGSGAWRDLLDDQAIQALADVLPRATQYEGNVGAIHTFINGVVRHVDHPAITGMLLDMARDPNAGGKRVTAAEALGHRIDEPGVRTLLAILSTDADPELRAAARRSLVVVKEGAAGMPMDQ